MLANDEGDLAEELLDKLDDEAAVEAEVHDEKGSATVMSSIFALGSCAVGSGILSFPSAFMHAGLDFAAILTVFFTSAMLFCHHAIATTCVRVAQTNPEAKTYQDIVKVVLGNKASKMLESLIIVNQFGCCAGYCIIFGDMAVPVAIRIAGGDTSVWYTDRQLLILVGSLAIMLPLCFLRTLYSLRHVSVISLSSCIYLVVMVMYKETTHPDGQPPVVKAELNFGFFQSLPLICFALQNLIPHPQVFHELPKRLQTVRNMDFIAACSYGLCLTMYLGMGMMGYLTFGAETPSDILKGYSADDNMATIARGCISIVALAGFPINLIIGRTAVYSIYLRARQSGTFFTPKNARAITPRRKKGEAMSAKFIYVCGTVWMLCALGLAFSGADLGVVFGLVGAICGASVIFMFPGGFWYHHGPEDRCSRVGPAYVIWAMGVVVIVMGSVITLKNAIEGN